MPLSSRLRSRTNVSAACCLSVALLTSAGCQKTDFSANELASAGYLQSTEPTEVKPPAEQAKQIVEELFGTPDSPKWPEAIPAFLNWADVERSAGPVGRAHDRVERGLYRKHCVQCHGITGDGGGPAAMVLAPYARDFRRGTFKFKSTPLGSKPTRSDLIRVIEHGISGTSMPAFAPLRNRQEFEHDIEAVTEYVMFLSIRGEVERRLLRAHAIDQDEINLENATLAAEQVLKAWSLAESQVPPAIEIPVLPAHELATSIERGKELFNSNKAACFKCHGPEGRGDGVSQDFDEWTKDWTIHVGIDPTDRSAWKAMKPFGARKPVVNASRNLQLGGLRGGATVEQVARRIQVGIDGTPMPSITVALDPTITDPPVGLSLKEFQDLVRFVCDTAGVPLDPTQLATPSQEPPMATPAPAANAPAANAPATDAPTTTAPASGEQE